MDARKSGALSVGSIAVTLLAAAGAYFAPTLWPLFAFFGVAGLIGAIWAGWLWFAPGKKAEPLAAPQRDWNMKEAHDYVLNEHYGADKAGDVNPFRDFRQAARDGALTVWGRRQMYMGADLWVKPHERIPAEHWSSMDFDYMRYVFGDGETVRQASTQPDNENRRDNPEPFIDLMVSSAEMKKLWPAKVV